jgi:uncharacterized membrane protein HdeD (DUF308 family)
MFWLALALLLVAVAAIIMSIWLRDKNLVAGVCMLVLGTLCAIYGIILIVNDSPDYSGICKEQGGTYVYNKCLDAKEIPIRIK